MAKYNQTIISNNLFSENIINMDHLLDEAIDWIKDNVNPDEVFDKDTLHEWAMDNNYFKEDA